MLLFNIISTRCAFEQVTNYTRLYINVISVLTIFQIFNNSPTTNIQFFSLNDNWHTIKAQYYLKRNQYFYFITNAII